MKPVHRLMPVAAFVLSAGTLPAHAADADTGPAAAASPLTTTVTVASQYVSRGIRQTWGRPALQAGIDYADPGGWSAGTWVSNVDDRFVEGGSVEWDLYGGYGGNFGSLGYSGTLTWYKYPGARISATDTAFDYGELATGLSWKSLYAKYSYTISPDFFGITGARGTGYLDVGLNHELGRKVTLNLHAGDGRVAGSGNGIWNWHDLKAGLSRPLEGGWLVALNYTRAYGASALYEHYSTGVARGDGRPAFANVGRRALVLSLSRTF